MPELIRPDFRLHASYVDAMRELQAEGRGGPDDDSTLGRAIREYGPRWQDPQVFAEYVDGILADAEVAGNPEGYVPRSTFWYVDGNTYLGRVAIRHFLTPALLERNGHIGYYVRPTARRRGHATAMLRAALPLARKLGIESALITCDLDNTASRKVIEACGGVYEGARSGKLRFWVPTLARIFNQDQGQAGDAPR
ncbi:GNAT family N-acetyltransferase [Streptomyces sp. NPDC002088]|uniref:GNAT family N-acetyltransferase n=1 Tax=Streptomyces sp. NPDC002088 TaxID=3154665 RepID=UPI0033228669